MPTKIIPLDMDFEIDHGVPPLVRSYPNMNPPTHNEVRRECAWPRSQKVELSFYVDRNVDIHSQKELATAIRTLAWRRLSDYRFTEDPRTLPYRYYHVKFIFSTHVAMDWWHHVFVVRMMSEMARVEDEVTVNMPHDNPFFRLSIVC